MCLLSRRIQRALRAAGFDQAEWRAVRDTPAMWAQLTRFAQGGGRIQRVDAAFAGATGQPGLIRFFCPPAPHACSHSTYGALAHELGHALFMPQQWWPPAQFQSAHAYARARELGEAQAWLNQYRLCRAKVGGVPETSQVQHIENDHDFGTQPVDLFARMAAREAAGWTDAQMLDELAILNANMFPCGMGEGNFKTYGQCNRWDWLQATLPDQPALRDLLARLPRPPDANDQKLLMKFNVFSGGGALPDSEESGSSAAGDDLARLAAALSAAAACVDLEAMYATVCRALPNARPGVAGDAAAQAFGRAARPSDS